MAWIPDPLAPCGWRWQRPGEQPPTELLPIVVPPAPVGPLPDDVLPWWAASGFEHPDGSVYARADLDQLELPPPW